MSTDDYRVGTKLERIKSSNNYYDILIIGKNSIQINDAFKEVFVITTEGYHLRSRLINRIYSAVRPTEQYRHWWNGLIERAKDPRIHWLF